MTTQLHFTIVYLLIVKIVKLSSLRENSFTPESRMCVPYIDYFTKVGRTQGCKAIMFNQSFLTHLILTQQLTFLLVVYGSWFDHVLSWEEHKNAKNILIISYEEMKKVSLFCHFNNENLSKIETGNQSMNSIFIFQRMNLIFWRITLCVYLFICCLLRILLKT